MNMNIWLFKNPRGLGFPNSHKSVNSKSRLGDKQEIVVQMYENAPVKSENPPVNSMLPEPQLDVIGYIIFVDASATQITTTVLGFDPGFTCMK